MRRHERLVCENGANLSPPPDTPERLVYTVTEKVWDRRTRTCHRPRVRTCGVSDMSALASMPIRPDRNLVWAAAVGPTWS